MAISCKRICVMPSAKADYMGLQARTFDNGWINRVINLTINEEKAAAHKLVSKTIKDKIYAMFCLHFGAIISNRYDM